MTYARLLDNGQLARYDGHAAIIDGKKVYNPREETLLAAGYLPVPETDATRVVESWTIVDGALVPTYREDEPETPSPRVFSKLRMVAALKSASLWDAFKSWLVATDLWDYFDAANDLREDNAQFGAAIAAARDALGVTDEQIEAILDASVADGEEA